MTRTPKDEIETLLRLRNAFDPADWNPDYFLEAEDDFCVAAHAALGPDGCVTKELERLEALFQQTHGVHSSWVEAERSLRAKVERLQEERDSAPNLPVLLALRAERDVLKAELAHQRNEINRLSAELILERVPGTPVKPTR